MEHTSLDQEIIVQYRVFEGPSLRKFSTAASYRKSFQVQMQTWAFRAYPHIFEDITIPGLGQSS